MPLMLQDVKLKLKIYSFLIDEFAILGRNATFCHLVQLYHS